MKKLATALQTGDLRPKERVLLWVRNTVTNEKTGKEMLTPAQKHALVEGWRPANNEEVREFNRYNDGWRLEGAARLDAQTIYLNSQIALLQAGVVLGYAIWTDYKDTDKGFLPSLKTMVRSIDENDAHSLIVQNTGLEFDRVAHRYAFLKLSEEVKQDMLKLYPDCETETQYMDQEEIIAGLFNGKKYLTSEAKEKLADLIIDGMRNKYVNVLREKGLKTNEWWFGGYFAELPTVEIAKKWAQYTGIPYDAEDKKLEETLAERIQHYADEHKTHLRVLLKTALLRWLNEGLFVEEYEPIWNSNTKETCNDADTKLPHKDIFSAWLKAKVEAKTILQELIDTGKLLIENREKDFLGFKETMKIITGESLRNLEGDYTFSEDYRKQTDDLKPLGTLVLYLREQDLLEGYTSLLSFAEMYKKISKVYDIDLGYKIDSFLAELKRHLSLVNIELQRIEEKLTEAIYNKHKPAFLIEIFMSDLLFNIDDIRPGSGETEMHYAGEFRMILGDEY